MYVKNRGKLVINFAKHQHEDFPLIRKPACSSTIEVLTKQKVYTGKYIHMSGAYGCQFFIVVKNGSSDPPQTANPNLPGSLTKT